MAVLSRRKGELSGSLFHLVQKLMEAEVALLAKKQFLEEKLSVSVLFICVPASLGTHTFALSPRNIALLQTGRNSKMSPLLQPCQGNILS